MATVTSLGIGSGVDINGLVTQLVEAEKELPSLRLDTREAELQAQLSSYGLLKGAMSSFSSSISSLRFASTVSGIKADISDPDVLSASVSITADEGSHSIEVVNLAQSHVLATSDAYEDETTSIGTGTLSFTFGKTTYDNDGNYVSFEANEDKVTQDIEITDGSLTGIMEAVNEAGIGVTASIVNIGSDGYKLLFASDDLGANNSLEITVTDDETDNVDDVGLSQLAYNASASNMDETVAAQDAEVKYNGLTVFRETNYVDDLVKGLGITLKSVSDGQPLTVDIVKDTNELKGKVQEFINAYNDLNVTITSQAGYDTSTNTGGVLLGDTIVRSMTTQMRQIMGDVVTLGDNRTVSLATVGITTLENGNLALDEAKFEEVAEEDPKIVANLLAMSGNAQGENLTYVGMSSRTVAGTYRVSVSQPATQGTYTGGADISDFAVNASNEDLSLRVNGIETGDITIKNGAYADGATLAQAIEVSINSSSALREANLAVNVRFENNRLVIASDTYGSDSSIELISAAGLGLGDGEQTDGVDIAGNFGQGAASGNGQFLTGEAGDIKGLKIEYAGSESGVVGGVTVSRGYADRLYGLVQEFLDDEGGIEGRTSGIEARIVDINEQRVALSERLLSMEKRLRARFGAMDALVAQLQATGNFLTQQLDALPKIEVRKS